MLNSTLFAFRVVPPSAFFQDALVAVLSLQNALIIANGTSMESMIPLTGWTSGAIWLLIVTFTARSFWDGVAKK